MDRRVGCRSRFVRCRAVVQVTLLESPEVIQTYAQRLDHRLQPVVCR